MLPQPPRPSLATEAAAGLTTFFTLACIVVVNPSMLASEGTGMPFDGVLTATVAVCFVMTLLMGAYIGRIAGIRAGGRTGRTSIVTACCFLPCFFVAPLAASVPPFATSAVLVIVGAAMFQPVRRVDFARIEEGLPAFATIVLIPLTFDYPGNPLGFILHAVLYVAAGRAREVHPMMYALAGVAVGLLLLAHGRT